MITAQMMMIIIIITGFVSFVVLMIYRLLNLGVFYVGSLYIFFACTGISRVGNFNVPILRGNVCTIIDK